MQRRHSLQFVWPKDGHRGRGHRGFWGRLNNIVSGKGPDIFIQRKKSKEPIMQDQWQNWDSYRFFDAHLEEETYPASRGYERYDPHTRTYKKWSKSEDWGGVGIDGYGIGEHGDGLPRFTRDEWVKMKKRRARGHKVEPSQMGRDWTRDGPKRWEPKHNEFWRNAHRQSENEREGIVRWNGLNHNMRANLPDRQRLAPWMWWEGIY